MTKGEVISSLLLINWDGGADLVFLVCIGCGFVLHALLIIVNLLMGISSNRESKWSYIDLLAFISTVSVFFWMGGDYLAYAKETLN